MNSTSKKSPIWLSAPLMGTLSCILALIAVTGCSPRIHVISGNAMGTTYHIKVVAGRRADLYQLPKQITACLERIENSMSTFRPGSEISRFNRLPAGRPFQPSPDFSAVMKVAARIYRLSQGAWDGTVKPLVDLWGFSANGPPSKLPAPAAIKAARKATGFSQIAFLADGRLVKSDSRLHLDLASIAKGYGVDQIARLIAGAGFKNFLVEIGGEVAVSGKRPDGKPWQVGINRPAIQASASEVIYAVGLDSGAMATSGNYRRFYRLEGKIYSHIIDPRTGYPCTNRVVSATVIAPSCTLADGLATALMVMGPDKGMAMIETLEAVEALILVQTPGSRLQQYLSSGFPPSTLP